MPKQSAKIIALASQKGGVGKTTTTLNLSAALIEKGQRVLLIDLDLQGSLALAFRINPRTLRRTIADVLRGKLVRLSSIMLEARPGLHLVPSNGELSGAEAELLHVQGREYILKEKLQPQLASYDFILIDCPSSLGLLTINALTAAHWVLVPVQCHYFALQEMDLLFEIIERVRTRSNPALKIIGILPTMLDARMVQSREAVALLEQRYGGVIFKPPIHMRAALADAPVMGQTILEFDPWSDVADAHRTLAAEVIRRA